MANSTNSQEGGVSPQGGREQNFNVSGRESFLIALLSGHDITH